MEIVMQNKPTVFSCLTLRIQSPSGSWDQTLALLQLCGLALPNVQLVGNTQLFESANISPALKKIKMLLCLLSPLGMSKDPASNIHRPFLSKTCCLEKTSSLTTCLCFSKYATRITYIRITGMSVEMQMPGCHPQPTESISGAWGICSCNIPGHSLHIGIWELLWQLLGIQLCLQAPKARISCKQWEFSGYIYYSRSCVVLCKDSL